MTVMVELLESFLGTLRRWAHYVVPPGRSPESYRRAIRAIYRRMVYDPKTQTVMVKKGELAGARKYGPSCEGDFEFALGKYEPEVAAAFRQYCRPGMTVFDIGANAGHHLLLLSKLCGDSGHLHAFEPVRENIACLKETLRLNRLGNVTLHELAVSDGEGAADFKFSGVFDGFACLAQGGHGHTLGEVGRRSADRAVPRGPIRVATIDLDTFCDRFCISRVDLIKVDIEGAELLALRGMMRTLRAHHPVLIMELWGAEHVAQGPGILAELGYETRTLNSWQGWVGGEMAETSNVLALPKQVSCPVRAAGNVERETEAFAEKLVQRGD
jgi:FkbM family methyltransferase